MATSDSEIVILECQEPACKTTWWADLVDKDGNRLDEPPPNQLACPVCGSRDVMGIGP